MLGGSLRMDSGPGAGERVKARVPLYGCKVWRTEGYATRSTSYPNATDSRTHLQGAALRGG
jgi:hypothetical protein